MKILMLSNRIAYPLKDGGSLGMHYFIEGYLEANEEVSLLAMNTSKHWVDVKKLPKIYDKLSLFETVYVDNRVKPVAAFINLFKGTSYNIDRFISEAYTQKLIAILQHNTYDVIHMDSLFMTPYVAIIRKYSNAKIVMRAHNVEFVIWERLTLQASNPLKKAYLSLLTKRLKKYELEHLNSYDLLLPVSKVDEAMFVQLGCTIPIYTQSFGINTEIYKQLPEHKTNNPVKLYHLGAMDWLPNQESVQWLLDEIMPTIAITHPEVKLYLAGRNMPEHISQHKAPNVIVVGEVEDAMAFEADKDVLLVPLWSGSGVRIKIYQGMAMGKAIISTPVGIEGIDAQHNKEIKLATNAPEFINAVQELLNHPEQIKTLGNNAKKLIEEEYDSKNLIQKLLSHYTSLFKIHS